MILELGGRRRLALAAAFVAVVNPISWFDSVVWGQVDSVGVVFLLLGLRELWRDHPERAAIFTVIAALIKPQLGILIPILALVTIRRAFWPVRDAGGRGRRRAARRRRASGPASLAWERRTDHPIRIVTTGVVALITTVLLCLPFGLSVLEFSSQAPYLKSGLLAQIFATASGYPYLTVNAFNPWALIAGDTGYSLANAGLWVCDGPWGSDDLRLGRRDVRADPGGPRRQRPDAGRDGRRLAGGRAAARSADDPLSLTVLALAFYVVPTRVHERYAYPVFALAIMLAAVAWRWRVAYAVLTVTVFLNMYAALTNPFYKNPGIVDWLGIGPTLRSEPGVAPSRCSTARSSCGSSPSSGPGARAPGRRAWTSGAGCRRAGATIELGDGHRSPAAAPAGRSGRGTPRARRRRRAAPRGPRAGLGDRSGAAAAGAPASAESPPRPPGRRTRRGPAPMPTWSPRPTLRGGRDHRLVQGPPERAADPTRPQRDAPPRGRRAARPTRPVVRRPCWWSGRCCCGPSAWPSRTRCTSTRSTTPGPPPSSSRTGATACRTTSTNGPTRTSPST